MSALPEPQRINVGEISLSVHDAGEGPAVVLCHGFPELARSWRYQFKPLIEAGFRVIAADQRGYGASDLPKNVEDYDILHLTGDMANLLGALEIDKAIFVGHDWGGFVAWGMPVLYPERCLGVVGVNTPYTMLPSTDMMKIMFPNPEDFYISWFQQLDAPEAAIKPRTRELFEKIMRRGRKPEQCMGAMKRANPFMDIASIEVSGEALLDDTELDNYTKAFERSGFFGPVSWYRNADRNLKIAPEIGQKELDLPALQIVTDWDPAIPPEGAELSKAKCSDIEVHLIEQCGHWTQCEKPEELSKIMVDWMSKRFL